MIIGDSVIPILHVEGSNDLHVIGELMKASGHPLDPKHGPVVIKPHNSCTALLESFSASVKSAISLGCPVGFVLDMDRPEDNRIGQIRTRLQSFGKELSDDELTTTGIVKTIDGIKVGIWLMPSPAATSGKLEDFLRGMIADADPVLPISDEFVKTVGLTVPAANRFRDIDREKAEMCAWLAVQSTPGLPYGSAISAKFLSPSNPSASAFLQWMCNVFDLR